MAHYPQQSTSSVRRSRRDDTGSLDGSDIDHQQHQSPPSLPLFSTSSDRTITNSSTLSSKSGSSDGGSSTAANINNHNISNTVAPSAFKGAKRNSNHHNSRRTLLAQDTHNRALCKKALMQNDSMVYLGSYNLGSSIFASMHMHSSFLLLKFCFLLYTII